VQPVQTASLRRTAAAAGAWFVLAPFAGASADECGAPGDGGRPLAAEFQAHLPNRCLTPWIAHLNAGGHRVPPSIREQLDVVLRPRPREDPLSTWVSPAGLFSFHYTTAGADSVPDEDVDPANGVPDFVERCGAWADHCWHEEVDSLGFTAPLLPPDGTYDITFGTPFGWYGYTAPSGATTEIFLHRNFQTGPWPGPNDDPAGDQAGRAKVTIAHELKHASQYTNNGWTEGAWVELDAVWVEDVVYPYVNDYKYFVGADSGSQLDAPWVRLDVGGFYEDCLWQHWMSDQWGVDVIRDLWARRAQYPWESMLTSYQEMLEPYGSGWADGYAGYLEWCWFTGQRAVEGFGFADAPDLLRMRLYEPAPSSYPHVTAGTVDPMACHPRRFNPGTAQGSPRVVFSCPDDVEGLRVSLIGMREDDSWWIERPPLGPGGTLDTLLAEPWSNLQYLGVLVSSGDPWDKAADYALTVLDDPSGVVGARLAATPLARLEACPNPCRRGTTLSFAVPGASPSSIRLVDAAGRTVRTWAIEPSPAEGAVAWDGRDEGGRLVASGVYWAVLGSADRRVARKLVVVR
jgi:hypothetical protein